MNIQDSSGDPQQGALKDGAPLKQRIQLIDFEKLLNRDTNKLDKKLIEDFIAGKRVCVSGGGGSIGSELVRQIAAMGANLLLIERNENGLADIENEINHEFPDISLVGLVADITNKKEINSIFSDYKPEVVFHAAAHKHVNLMERSPWQAIQNNVIGTRNLAEASNSIRANNFILISTDKAVNPSSVMGATKKLAEILILGMDRVSGTNFDIVRFGNVIGSNGSVALIFKNQIAKGGPLTLTDPKMKRYFMTIPEAAELTLQASSIGNGGEIFVLDMGEPILIKTLAEKMIRQCLLEPYKDIDIAIIGAKPGEKLSEILTGRDEVLESTQYSKIQKIISNKVPHSELKQLQELLSNLSFEDHENIKSILGDLIPEYNPS